MSRKSLRTMRWGAVVGALAMALTGVRSARADDAAPAQAAPAAAPAATTAAPAPTPEAAPAAAPAKSYEDEKKKKAQAQGAPAVNAVPAAAPAAAPATTTAAPAAAPAVNAAPAAAPAAATPAAAPAAAPTATPVADVPAAPAPVTSDAAPVGATSGVTAKAPDAESQHETKIDDKPLIFSGFGIDATLGDSSGLYAGQEAYQNDWALYLAPSWRAGEKFFKNQPMLKRLVVSARWALQGEFAGTQEQFFTGSVNPNQSYQNCDSSAPSGTGGVVSTASSAVPYCQGSGDRRLDYSDIGLKVSDNLYTVPVALIEVKGSLGSALPVSAESQATGFITSLQPGVGLSRSFFNKKLTIDYTFGYTKYFYSRDVPVGDSTVEQTSIPGNPALGSTGISSTNNALDQFAVGQGGFSPSYGIADAFSVTYAPNEKFSFLVRYVIADTFERAAPSCTFNYGGAVGTVDLCGDDAAVAANSGASVLQHGDHGVQQFWITADYQALEYLDVGASLITVSPQRQQNGTWQQPFLTTDYRNYSSFNLSVTLTTEALAAKLLHKS